MKYSEKKIDKITKEIVDFLLEQDEGFNSTVNQLATKMGYSNIEFFDLFELNGKVFELADKKGLTLDMSKHDGKEEGLPFDLDFVLRKES